MKKNILPIHIFLFIGCCLAVLAILCAVLPKSFSIGGLAIRTPYLGQVVGCDSVGVEDSLDWEDGVLPLLTDSVAVVDDKQQQLSSPDSCEKPLPTSDSQVADKVQLPPQQEVVTVIPDEEDTTDMHIYLSDFYEALQSADDTPVRVVHYGDSQIEEDRLSMQVRRALQARYGGGGVGLIPLHQTIGTRTSWQSLVMAGQAQKVSGGPKRYLVYGLSSYRRKGGVYGPMGQVAIMDNDVVSGSEDMTLHFRAGVKQIYSESRFNRVRIWKKGDLTLSVNKATGREGDTFIVPDSTTSVIVHLNGQGEVYGISMEQSSGVMVDNIPMRGSSGAVFTSIASDELMNYYKKTNTRLIILQYGGNIMPYTTTKTQVVQYVEKMRIQIQYLKYLAPNSSILFVGPSDMCERRDGRLQTCHMIPVMDRALKQMAIEEEISYFSLYHSMGGSGSMVQWHDKGWVGGDYIHFTPKGAEKAGEMLANWLINK